MIGARMIRMRMETGALRRRVASASKGPLSRAGAILMREARRKIVPGTKVHRVPGKEEVKRYYRERVLWIRAGRPAEGRPRPPGSREIPASAGAPPRSRTGLLKRNLFFALTGRGSVVTGPAALSGVKGWRVPAALERGEVSGDMFGCRRRVADHPVMGPALEENLGKLAGEWRNAFFGG